MHFDNIPVFKTDSVEHLQPVGSAQRFLDIVLITKATDHLHSFLYQLHSKKLQNIKQMIESETFEPLSIEKGDILLIGEAVAIDRSEKKIYLTNKEEISYNYLISTIYTCEVDFSTSQEDSYNWEMGIHLFEEALRLRRKLLYFNGLLESMQKHKKPITQDREITFPKESSKAASSYSIQMIIPAHLYTPSGEKRFLRSQFRMEKLYEIQL